MESRRIVVVGAGVVGAALAQRLAGGGARVTLLERAERPGRGTSRWSLAWVNSNGKTPRAYHELSVRGMEAWARLARAVGGGDAWYRPVGNMRWAEGEEERRRLAERVERLRAWGYGAELVGRAEAARLEPALDLPEGVGEVAWFPDEGYVLTEPLIDALVARAVDGGAEVRTGEAGRVVAVDGEGAGRSTVRTADGGLVRADVVVCCAGRWTPEVTRLAGAEVPVVDPEADGSPAPGLVVRVGPVQAPPVRVLHTPHVHLRAHRDGEVHLEAGDVTVGVRTPAAELDGWATTLLERARRIAPSLSAAAVTGRHACVRPLPPDGLPVVGRTAPAGTGVGAGAGTYVVVTHSGVTLAAGLAELVARELLEDVRLPQLAPFRPERLG